jgi:hypothetical protein
MSEYYLFNLPEDIFYNILLYLEQPVYISRIIYQQIAPLCSAAKRIVEDDSPLWEIILGGYYLDGTQPASINAYRARTQRRSSKRLRRTTAKQDVIHATFVLRDQTEMALQEVADMAIAKTPKPLSVARLRAIIHNYGPILNINQRSAIGGTFLVDCCRARCVKESVILACVKELIERFGASPNVPATEGSLHQQVNRKKQHNALPALVVAATRGMPSIVKYLIEHTSAHTNEKGYCRFRLFSNPKKSICGFYTPLEFAEKMREAELENGASDVQLRSLNQCIRLLKENRTYCKGS